MEIYFVKEYLNETLDYMDPIGIEIIEKVVTTEEIIPINNWISKYKKQNPLECPPFLLFEITNLLHNGRVFWYTPWNALNFRYYFYDMAHVKNISLLREIKLNTLIDY
jgi:hypothetical protein